MEANRKKKLPQEGTGFSAAGESLGEPSGSSCPTYSGGGKDRSRQASDILGNSRSSMVKSPSSESDASVERNKLMESIKETSMIEALMAREANNLAITNLEDKVSCSIQEHILDCVIVVEKFAFLLADRYARRSLNDAAMKIKSLLVTVMKKEENRMETRSKLLILRRELEEKKETVRLKGSLTGLKNKSTTEELSSIITSSDIKDLFTEGNVNITNNRIPAHRPEMIEEQLEKMVQALLIKKNEIKKKGDLSRSFLKKYMLDSVDIVRKVGIVTKDYEESIVLENAACDVEEVLQELLKRSSRKNKQQSDKDISKGEKLPQGIKSNASDAAQFKLDGKKLTKFLKKYLQDTVNDYLDSCEDELLNKKEIEQNKGAGAKQEVDMMNGSHKLSPALEPIYDVWYEMDQFKEFAMTRIEGEATRKTVQTLLSVPCIGEDKAANEDLEQDEVSLLRQQPFWWTAEIAELRRVCMMARRKYTRSRRRRQRDENMEMEHYAAYRSLKKALNAAMKKAKSDKENKHEHLDDSRSS